MRKRDETLRETLLDYAREIATADGLEAINIRAIASKAGVASGTVYNYFSGKDDILLALTEEYWRNTLRDMQGEIRATGFVEQLTEIYAFLRGRIAKSGGMLMGSLHNVEEDGRARMHAMQQVLRSAVIQRMQQDKALQKDIWNEVFTPEEYADFIIMNIMGHLQVHAPDIRFFAEIVNRTLYTK